MNSGRQFEWDDAKARSNLAKHGVPFAYAARVFLDPDVVDFDASKPEDGEVRRKAVGVIEGRLFALVYTARDDVIRIISARRCNAAEARRYGPVHA
ncbi:BrnT family toxin [Phenylobacterium sp.]|uniref:BrnT family toxin n=1 Tax=Phenylobacterium sp. TaxID=1871053 RepID=UPI002FCA9112